MSSRSFSNLDKEGLLKEIGFRTSRSSGKGGQNVNKVSTRVELLLDINSSTVLTDLQKERIREKLSTRINKDGILRVVSQKERTQHGNKKRVVVKFLELIELVLQKQKKRKPTRVPKGIKEKRLKEKKAISEKKSRRRKDSDII